MPRPAALSTALGTTNSLARAAVARVVADGLMCFPFLVFHIPLVGEALTKCRSTAYDQTGQLVVKLSKSDVYTLYERRHAARNAHMSAAASAKAAAKAGAAACAAAAAGGATAAKTAVSKAVGKGQKAAVVDAQSGAPAFEVELPRGKERLDA